MANLTRTRQAVIIEPLRPEKFFVKTFNATSLYILSICEVCGSYQCPYCPFYSGAPSVQSSSIFILILATLTLTWDRTFVRMTWSLKSTNTNISLWQTKTIISVSSQSGVKPCLTYLKEKRQFRCNKKTSENHGKLLNAYYHWCSVFSYFYIKIIFWDLNLYHLTFTANWTLTFSKSGYSTKRGGWAQIIIFLIRLKKDLEFTI